MIFSSCNKVDRDLSQWNLSREERLWMEKFFKDVMLEESAIYTLMGTKPITTIPLYLYTDEELQAHYDQLSQKEKEEMVEIDCYDLPENWKKWEQLQHRFRMGKYLFFLKTDPKFPKTPHLFFVNILKTALVLQEQYECFKRETGLDFDPFQVVLEVEKGSEFWDKVLGDSALIGLLYGFGSDNSFAFRWKHSAKTLEFLVHHFSDVPRLGKATLNDFPLPIFASFSEKDEIIEKYARERERIRREYKGQDFLDFTLNKLTLHSK